MHTHRCGVFPVGADSHAGRNPCYAFDRAVCDEEKQLLLGHGPEATSQQGHTGTAYFQQMAARKPRYAAEAAIERYGA